MDHLYDLPSLGKRMEAAAAAAVPSSSEAAAKIARAALKAGSLTRAEAQFAGGLAERRTRDVLKMLEEAKLAEVSRKDVRLRFTKYDLFPNLFPQGPLA
jgi:hypothetical protein